MNLGQMPELGGGLKRKKRIVVGEQVKQVHALDRLHPRIARHFLDESFHRHVGRALPCETIDAERRHRPIVDDPQLTCAASPSATRRRALRPTWVS